MDQPILTSTGIAESQTKASMGIQAIDVGYSALKPHLEKSRNLLITPPDCAICHERLPAGGDMTLVCPGAGCETASHMQCFASAFLKRDTDNLIPTNGSCPGCGANLHWSDLVKELSLRMRGGKEVDKIFKVRKPRGKKSEEQANVALAMPEDESEEDEQMEDDLPIEDEWHHLSDFVDDEEDDHVVASDPNPFPKAPAQQMSGFAIRSEPLVEDSDWDDAEVIF